MRLMGKNMGRQLSVVTGRPIMLLTLVWVLSLVLLPFSGEQGLRAEAKMSLRTPAIMANGSTGRAEVGFESNMTVGFDVRSISGRQVRICLFLLPTTNNPQDVYGNHPARQWTFARPAGSEMVDLQGLPVGVYSLVAFALNDQSQVMAAASKSITVEHGGLPAWEAFNARKSQIALYDSEQRASGQPTTMEVNDGAPLEKVGLPRSPVEIPVLSLSQSNLVLQPGQSVVINAKLSNTVKPLRVYWTLQGPGVISISPDTKHATYMAPEHGEHKARLSCHLKDRDVEPQYVNIIVSSIPEAKEDTARDSVIEE